MVRALRRLLVTVVRRPVLRSFTDEIDLSQVHDLTDIVPKIFKAILMIRKLVVCFNVELELSGNLFTEFFQSCTQ